MEKARRKKAVISPEEEDDAVEVRVSARTPRALPPPPASTRAQNFATALIEAMIGQLTDYVENSPAVAKLVQVQTEKVLRELAQDPQLAALIRTQAEQYIAELASKPEILAPVVKAQVDRYLDSLLKDPNRLEQIAERVRAGSPPAPPTRKAPGRTKKKAIE